MPTLTLLLPFPEKRQPLCYCWGAGDRHGYRHIARLDCSLWRLPFGLVRICLRPLLTRNRVDPLPIASYSCLLIAAMDLSCITGAVKHYYGPSSETKLPWAAQIMSSFFPCDIAACAGGGDIEWTWEAVGSVGQTTSLIKGLVQSCRVVP